MLCIFYRQKKQPPETKIEMPITVLLSPVLQYHNVLSDKIRCSCTLFGLSVGSNLPNHTVISGVKNEQQQTFSQIFVHISKQHKNHVTYTFIK